MKPGSINRKIAIVLSGGYGRRLNGYRNPLKCKPLIRAHDERTLLEHTIDSLKSAQVISKAIIVGRDDRRVNLLAVLDNMNFPYEYVGNQNNKQARSLLQLCSHIIEDDSFFLLCGHAPPPPKHLQQMSSIENSEYDYVVTCYPHIPDTTKVIIDAQSHTIKQFIPPFSKHYESIDNNCYSIDSPFLFKKRIIDLLAYDQFEHWYDYHLYNEKAIGFNVHAIVADFPKEADTKPELIQTLNFLKGHADLYY